MNSKLRSIILTTIAGVAILSVVAWLWSYALSFQSVTFRYDDSIGYVELTSDTSEPLYPPADTEVRLPKGTYQLQTIGDSVQSQSRELRITDATDEVSVNFAYTRAYLDSLYSEEREAIQTSLLARYPAIESLYTITNGALYGRGDIFGAKLVAKTPSDNSDTLRIVAQKQSGEWRVLSTPPPPVLSAPEYPEIDVEILRQINQAK